jgi:phosphoribosyl-dephospho-CoA transferase
MSSLPSILKTHDLLRLSCLELEQGDAVKPEWLDAVLKACPWVVVRRAASHGKRVPVGVRGKERAQRWAGFVNREKIAQIVSPNQLRESLVESSRRGLRAFHSLRFLGTKAALKGLDWGPGGSAGFELASGRPIVTEASDLDIIVRAPEPFDRSFANSICIQLEGVSTRVDVLIETPYCGFSLDEYARGQLDKVLVRTDTGHIFAADPWDIPNRRQSWR